MEGSVESRPARRGRPMGRSGAHRQNSRGRRQHNQLPAAPLSHPAYAGTGAAPPPPPAAAPGNFVYQSLQGAAPAAAAHLKPPRRSWASAPRPVYYQQLLPPQIHQQQLQLHLPLPPPSSSFPHLLASHYHRLYGPHIHNHSVNVNYFHSNLIAAPPAMSSPTSPRAPMTAGGTPPRKIGEWEKKVLKYCSINNVEVPRFELMSDRRGGRTAWSCQIKRTAHAQYHTCTLDREPAIATARYWYSGTENAYEDAAEVLYKMWTEQPPMFSGEPAGKQPPLLNTRTPPTSPGSRARHGDAEYAASGNYTHSPPQAGPYGGGSAHLRSYSASQDARHPAYAAPPTQGKAYVHYGP
ncbi:hypothetical protein EDC01DRAFT_123459 [Geopyxis carbonaria]|nr:hypothetical protein EDC01DRAFT_123459 [Geopyxis carbonaria]